MKSAIYGMLRWLMTAAVGLWVAPSTGVAADAAYPLRPLRIVNAFPPGGNTDIIARAVAQKLTERLGQQVIVENRPGAGSMIGTDYVAKATPDGYTLLLVSGAVPTQASVLKKLPFDPLRDLAWISNAMIRKRFTDMGGTVMPSTPDEFGRHVASEIAKGKKIAAVKKIEIQ